MTYKPCELGQIDPIFGLWSRFIGRSVYAGLQVSTYSGYHLCHLVQTQTHKPTAIDRIYY